MTQDEFNRSLREKAANSEAKARREDAALQKKKESSGEAAIERIVAAKVQSEVAKLQLNSGSGIQCTGSWPSYTVSEAGGKKQGNIRATAVCNDDGTISITITQ